MLRRIRALLENQDLRSHPIRGISRRVVWHLLWLLRPRGLRLVVSQDSIRLLTPRSGSGGLIYYNGVSEPETTEFIKHFLRPGMVFVDVGAHLGEYTVLAAKILNHSGHVHAFEPRPDVFEVLTRNIELNHCRNVTALEEAVWCKIDSCNFEMTEEPSVSSLRPNYSVNLGAAQIRVHTTTLDDCFSSSTAKPNLIKVDVEGAELQVFQGAKSLLALSQADAPTLVFEYGPRNSKRFGYPALEILMFLRGLGYTIFTWAGANLARVEGNPVLLNRQDTCNLIAMKVGPSGNPELNG